MRAMSVSRALTNAERNYSTGEKEALAIVWATEKWHYFTYGRRIIIRTDHQALKSLLVEGGNANRPLRIHRWTERLRMYDAHIVYINGKTNHVADMLSRWAVSQEENVEPIEKHEVRINHLINAFNINSNCENPVSEIELVQESKNDPTCIELRKEITNGWKECKESVKKILKVKDELWITDDGCVARGARILIPERLRLRVLQMAHSAHQGMVRAKQLCLEAFFCGQESIMT